MNPNTTQPQGFNEGAALFITFAILFGLSTWSVTSKFALWVAIAIAALVWVNAYNTTDSNGQRMTTTFWQALAK